MRDNPLPTSPENSGEGNIGESLIKTLWLDQSTLWSIQDQQVAQNILIQGTNPGLGIREIHQKDSQMK